ncbi:Hypothetical predicted protein [Octopus vulgaris]|uniref:Uncharacterized protein n=1 Tax=Octopus vulgaris TaxID=6645 RepID=A0AA36BGC8_OCTVU|nr:Hypothetical predicted protein [Octopus vulgaris]
MLLVFVRDKSNVNAVNGFNQESKANMVICLSKTNSIEEAIKNNMSMFSTSSLVEWIPTSSIPESFTEHPTTGCDSR